MMHIKIVIILLDVKIVTHELDKDGLTRAVRCILSWADRKNLRTHQVSCCTGRLRSHYGEQIYGVLWTGESRRKVHVLWTEVNLQRRRRSGPDWCGRPAFHLVSWWYLILDCYQGAFLGLWPYWSLSLWSWPQLLLALKTMRNPGGWAATCVHVCAQRQNHCKFYPDLSGLSCNPGSWWHLEVSCH